MTHQKILVTGANGQLGREMQQLSTRYHDYDFIFRAREELSINNSEHVRTVFEQERPAFCVNCAAYTAVDKAESDQEAAFEINGKAPGILALLSKEFNCRFIHLSTDYVFDGMETAPYKEDSAVNPQSEYGASKLEGEKQAMQFNDASIIIRSSWVYSEFGKNFVKTMIRLMNEKEEINVVNDQFGSPTYAHDLAEAILSIVGKTGEKNPKSGNLSGTYHFSNGGIITWFQFALAIKELSGSSCKVNPISTAEYPTPAKRPAYSALDSTKIRETFGIELKNWKESLALCMKRIKENGGR